MERAIRRAKLPIAFSEGFTPRPIMSFGFALPVGVLSVAEYGDFRFAEALDPGEFLASYNRHLPTGFEVLKAEVLPDGAPSLMSKVNAASWEVVVQQKTVQELEERWQWLQGVDSFVVERETKKGIRKVDIRPLLFEVASIEKTAQGGLVKCFTALGKEGNLRIDELGMLLEFDHLAATITRTGQYNKVDNHYRAPFEN